MSTPDRNILSLLDSAVRWTGVPARVARQVSDAPSVDREQHPLRWSPLLAIACSCILFVLSLMWPSAVTTSLGAVIVAMVPTIHMIGPLGQPSLEDDEREAELRKDCFVFCLGLLAFLNCVGQLLLMSLSHLQKWQTAHAVLVAASAFLFNLTLFGCLPTLYASWKLRPLSKQ